MEHFLKPGYAAWGSQRSPRKQRCCNPELMDPWGNAESLPAFLLWANASNKENFSRNNFYPCGLQPILLWKDGPGRRATAGRGASRPLYTKPARPGAAGALRREDACAPPKLPRADFHATETTSETRPLTPGTTLARPPPDLGETPPRVLQW